MHIFLLRDRVRDGTQTLLWMQTQGDFKMECKYSIIIKCDPTRVNEALWGRGQIWDKTK